MSRYGEPTATLNGRPVYTGWRSTIICEVAGVSYRQLDHWTREGITPATYEPGGTGTQRLYDVDAATRVVAVARLVRAGMRPPAAAAILSGAALPDGVTVSVDLDLIRAQVGEALAVYPMRREWPL